jgi:hypothetical protein
MDTSYAASFFSSEEMEELFQEVFGPLMVNLEFEYAGKIRWVRETGEGLKHLFYLYPFRPGADYYPYGALSFDYVPRMEAGKLRLRPSAKHARVHLVVTHIGFRSTYGIGRSRDEARQRSITLSEPIVGTVDHGLKPIRTPANALDFFRRDKASKGIAFYHYPETALSYAFTLAKAGFRNEAETELSALLRKQPGLYSPEAVEQMRSLLASV